MSEHNQLPRAPVTELLYGRASRARIPLSGTFELSPVCNFSCRMCYVRKTRDEVAASPRPPLSLSDWLRIAEEARDEGMLYLLLTGGEPLLWPHFKELYEALIRMGFLLSVNTNGSLLDEEMVALFRRFPPRRINITLYGANDATYTRLCGVKGVLDRVKRGVEALQEAGVCVKLNCSLTTDNVGDLEAMVAYAKERGLVLDVASYMFPPVRRDADAIGRNEARFTPADTAKYRIRAAELQASPEQFRAFLASIREGMVDPPGLDEGCYDPLDGHIRCRAGKASFWITWDGCVTPCGMMTTPRVDLVKTPFSHVWNALTEASAAVRLSGVCAACKNIELCHPCAAMAAAETGTPAGIPRYLCETAVAMRRIAEAAADTPETP